MRILVIQPEGIGEAVYTTPVILALLAMGHEVDIAVTDPNSLVATILRLPSVGCLYPIEAVKAIRQRRPDAAALCCGWSKWHKLRSEYQLPKFIAPPPIDLPGSTADKKCHVADYFFDVARKFGYEGTQPYPAIPAGERMELPGNRPRLLLCPGYRKDRPPARKKHWGNENFAALAIWFVDRFKGSAHILGDKEDEETNGRKIQKLSARHASSLCGRLTCAQLLGAMRTGNIAVGNSTGLVHISAALGLPAAQIWKSGAGENRWGPLGSKGTSIKYTNPKETMEKVHRWCETHLV